MEPTYSKLGEMLKSESEPLAVKRRRLEEEDPLALYDNSVELEEIQYTTEECNNPTDFDYDDLIEYCPEVSDEETITESGYRLCEVFLQRDNCFLTSQSLPQCYECETDPMTNKYNCRFYEFRKIEKSNGTYRVAGFLDPHIDPSVEDLDLWTTPDDGIKLDQADSDYILRFVASIFCEVAEEELKVSENHGSQVTAWKRSVLQVREICDVCDTSVFNFHWTCFHCGTCVCIDCNNERKMGLSRWKPTTKADKEERDEFFWLKCNSKIDHDMLLTQMTTGDSLMFLNNNLHTICEKRNITQRCGCSMRVKSCLKILSKNIMLEDPKLNLRQIIKRQRYKSKPSRRTSLGEQKELYIKVDHVHVARGQILKILHPSESEDDYKVFQDQWEMRKPVVIANATQNLRKDIWEPEYFSKRFGSEKHVMINCQNDVSINRVAMKHFWDGFGSIEKRLPKDCEKKLVLKLKDWPTSDDFANVLKDHFEVAMNAVPMKAYTTRNGKFNLARYLPDHFSRPDLGPKMYSAYAQPTYPEQKASTNLHLDISDAVNVLVHVSKPVDSHLAPKQYSIEAIKTALEQSGADESDKRTLLSGAKLPGAIWHIFQANQADKMRKVLHAVAKERGEPLESTDDPIHDQNWFIDSTLRKRLKDNGVEAYTIVQYEGDAVFIPAGAPHQVQNVLDCIKIALDFVSPENLYECFNLTDEFRILSTRHANHEDKLQIKNILFHLIKNLVSAQPDLGSSSVESIIQGEF